MAKTTTAKPKAKALSLHLGLNAVDPVHYGGWSGELAACERDATDMAALAKVQKMKPTVLLTRSATRAKTIAALNAAAKVLKKGDLFFLTYSGHGGQVRDVTGEEPDKRDETWCLYDSQLIDDELYFELAEVRVRRAHPGAVGQLPQRHGHPRRNGARHRRTALADDAA